MFRTNAIPASKRATQTSWQRTVQAQGMNSARRATELALILIKRRRCAAPRLGVSASGSAMGRPGARQAATWHTDQGGSNRQQPGTAQVPLPCSRLSSSRSPRLGRSAERTRRARDSGQAGPLVTRCHVVLRYVHCPTLQKWPNRPSKTDRSRSIRVGGYGSLLH